MRCLERVLTKGIMLIPVQDNNLKTIVLCYIPLCKNTVAPEPFPAYRTPRNMESEHEYANLARKPYYDLKWHFPIRQLENHRVKLVPWASDLHAEPFYEGVRYHPSVFDNIPDGPFTSAQDVKSLIDRWVNPKMGMAVFATLDISKSGSPLTGIIALRAASAANLGFELVALTLPAYQRQNMTAHAVGLILQYAFAPTPVGLGIRRVFCHTAIRAMDDIRNSPTVRLAEKIGFSREGVVRWHYTYPPGRSGMPGESEDHRARARHAVLLSICWDDWENGGKKRVASLLQAAETSARL
ncbi:hypothetical protein HWV62_10611 [Athelia sp. TMB]|nr:hypothetical protein HWV62_16476 [Athelia sp. TMB]KAF7975003.1 hypothetical protein HWV62_10611 [Athelia sp. TMB]